MKAVLLKLFFLPSGLLFPLSFNFYSFLFVCFFPSPQKIFQSSWLRAVTSKRNQEKVKPSRLLKTQNRSKKSQGEKILRLYTPHHPWQVSNTSLDFKIPIHLSGLNLGEGPEIPHSLISPWWWVRKQLHTMFTWEGRRTREADFLKGIPC